MTRCGWCTNDPLYEAYHDHEWGKPVHDDQHLFEMLCLEGAQAGLSWITVLKKRTAYRAAFHQFDIAQCAAMTDTALTAQLSNAGIIRNKLKVFGVRKNAQAALAVQKTHGSLDAFLWQFVGGSPIVNHWVSYKDAPTSTPQSDAMSRALKKAGFTFVGTTICYAFMQAVGMVNDHELTCPAR
jgi:DNA-3-methyladenine glycosylase I